ncbi:MAG TPA: FAD-linked oxidase C-terminal domain-containing protein [Candidatus Tectomicrobia bacterium]|nr:FAD-linked oxidase C-terminal domain-containing protein [Candidatus Tectomicrobia bacterium]
MDRQEFIAHLGDLLGPGDVLSSRADCATYGYDASVFQGEEIVAVAFPESTAEVAQIVRLAGAAKVPYLARGTGTGISGGAIPTHGGLVIELAKMNRVLEIDLANQRAVLEPGVINQDLKELLTDQGYGHTYVPDPGSQVVSTIGGNVANNAGGMHCLKYGVTTNHIVGLEVVLPGGEIITVGGKVLDQPGCDLTGLFVGSEGTLGIVTKIVVRIVRLPEVVRTQLALFPSVDDAANAVSAIMTAGILPAALELLDRACMEAVDEAIHIGFPLGAGAALIIELDGLRDGMQRTIDRVADICQQHSVVEVRTATTAEEATRLWLSRRAAYGALARLAPTCYIVDGCVPRTKLPEALARTIDLGTRYGLTIANIAHAGDGNLHPSIPFDINDPDACRRVMACGREILRMCADLGGTITGEHGVGIEKQNEMPFVFSPTDLAVMHRVKEVIDPENLCNPGKIFPSPTPPKLLS